MAAIGGSLPARPAAADDKPADQPQTHADAVAFQNEGPRDLELRDALAARYPNFGGFFVQEKSQVAVLLFQGAPPDSDELASIARTFGFGPGSYVVEKSDWSRADQIRLEEHLIETYGAGKIAGSDASAVSFSIDDEFGTVNMAVVGADAQTVTRAIAGDALAQKGLSSGRLRIEESAASEGDPLFADRWHDTPPYNGGNLLYTSDRELCTSGWPVVKNGNRMLLSAGHCGETKWFVGYPGSSSNYVGDTDGSTVAPGASAGSATGDSQTIEDGQGVSDKTWRYYSTRIQPVGTAAPGKGRVVCAGGAYTALLLATAGGSENEKCGTIDVVDAINNYGPAVGGSDGWRRGLSCVWGYRYIATQGDSGGPSTGTRSSARGLQGRSPARTPGRGQRALHPPTLVPASPRSPPRPTTPRAASSRCSRHAHALDTPAPSRTA